MSDLKTIGYTHIAVNDIGGYVSADGYADIAEFGLKDPNNGNFNIDTTLLSDIHADHSIALALLYIDFPGQMYHFQNDPGHTFQLMKGNFTTYSQSQSQDQYQFVYPILQFYEYNGGQYTWDSTKITDPNTGESIYTILKSLMNQYG